MLTLCSSIKTSRHQVVVLPEPRGAVSTKVELGEDGDQHRSENRRVDTDGQITETPTSDGGDEFVESVAGEETVSEVERNGDEETNDNADRNDEVNGTGRVEMFRESSPSDGLRVERLHLLTTPDITSLNGSSKVSRM